MDKIHRVGIEMPAVLSGLTRGLDLTVLDAGPSPLHFASHAQALGCILPSNSPGVHALWLPAIPLKTPLVLKPGREEPWTPLPHRPIPDRSRLSTPGPELLPNRPRRQHRNPAPLRSLAAIRRRSYRRSLARRLPHPTTRTRAQQDHQRRRQNRPMGALPRPQGRLNCFQWRPLLPQRLRHLGARPRSRNRRRPRRTPEPNPSPTSRRSPSSNRRLLQPRSSAPVLIPNRHPTRRRARHGERPRRTHRRDRRLHLPQPNLDPRPPTGNTR